LKKSKSYVQFFFTPITNRLDFWPCLTIVTNSNSISTLHLALKFPAQKKAASRGVKHFLCVRVDDPRRFKIPKNKRCNKSVFVNALAHLSAAAHLDLIHEHETAAADALARLHHKDARALCQRRKTPSRLLMSVWSGAIFVQKKESLRATPSCCCFISLLMPPCHVTKEK